MKQAITYILNGEKTEERVLTGGWNLQVDKAYEQMMDTKEVFGKTGGRQGYHIIISFKEGETDAEIALKIVEKFVKEYLSDYEAVYAVHDNTDHIHGHVIFNSVSFATGRKYHYKKNDWASYIQPIINRICEEYGLSTIELDEKEVHNRYQDWNEYRDGEFVWSDMIKRDIDIAIAEAENFDDFISIMESRGYIAKQNKYLAFQAPGMTRYRRTKQLGSDYTEERIRQRIPVESMSRSHMDTHLSDQEESEKLFYTRIPYIKRSKLTPIQKKYYSRLYKLGLLQKRPYSQVWKYKDEIRKLHKLQEQYLFLVDNSISDFQDVEKQLSELKADKRKKVSEKNKCYKAYKKCKELFNIADEMTELKFGEMAYNSGDSVFEAEHNRWTELSDKLKQQGYTYEEILSIREYYHNENNRLREEVREANRKVRIAEGIIRSYENVMEIDKISEKDIEEIGKDINLKVEDIDESIDKKSVRSDKNITRSTGIKKR